MTLIDGAALQKEMLDADDQSDEEPAEEYPPHKKSLTETVRETEDRLEGVDRVLASDGVEGTITARVPSYGGVVDEWLEGLEIESTTIYHIEWDDGVQSVRSALVADDLEVVR